MALASPGDGIVGPFSSGWPPGRLATGDEDVPVFGSLSCNKAVTAALRGERLEDGEETQQLLMNMFCTAGVRAVRLRVLRCAPVGTPRGLLAHSPPKPARGGLWVSVPGVFGFALWRRTASGVDFEGWSRVTTGLASTSCLPRGSPGRQRFL